MRQTLKRLFYYSESMVTPDKVPAIIRTSRANNGAWAITGALIYTGSRFGQLIEGPAAQIDALFETLRADPRHRAMQVCFEETCDDRWFAQWSMGYLTNIEFTSYVAALGDTATGNGAWRAATFRSLMEAAETL